MTSKTITYGILRAVGIIVGIILLLLFIYKIQSVIVYIAMAAVIALIGRPIVIFLKHRCYFPNALAVVTVLIIVLGVFIGLIGLFVPIIIEQSRNLSQIDLQAFKNDLNILNNQIRDYLGLQKEINILQHLQGTSYFKDFNLGMIPNFLNMVFSGFGAGLIAIFSTLFISFFFLKDSNLMLNSILVFSNRGEEARFKRVFNKIKVLLSRYFVGLTMQLFVLFVLYSILLMVFDIDNPIAIAFICAALNIVPYLGPIIAGVLMMLFVISSNLGSDFSSIILPRLLYILAGYSVAQLIDNFINQPLIFGKSVRSHPLEIFLIILIAGLLFGIIGMVIAIPSYTAIKVIAKEAFSEYKIVKKLTRDM
ncbi:AI-2E family transporter [Haloflavibacter putidus]|uniref:AI-2E family transporter n=1 Tax=Haloflavibacter putidus TaxID=2576776 RepID=A0A507ZZW2_9FLAO|nr:AI-2E family transporter [Haloflavibacter putidus]TQD40205.1 AI-2E family transporter [Haloflavibacter putidus]